MNKKIEVEGKEIAIKNSNGDIAIIPIKDVPKIKKYIETECDDCIDEYVSSLPKFSDYAEDGTLITNPTNNPFLTHTIPSDPKGSQNNPVTLPEVTVTANKPSNIKYREQYIKNNPTDDINNVEYQRNLLKYVELETKKEVLSQQFNKEMKRKEGLKSIEEVNQFTPIDINNYKTEEQTTKLQKMLVSQGYDLGKFGANKDGVDGKIGSFTKKAVEQYNQDNKTSISFNPTYKKNYVHCEEEHCAQYTLGELYRISDVDKSKLGPTEFAKQTGIGVDAWKQSDSIIEKGGTLVYNKKDNIDRSHIQPQVGDVVSIYTLGTSDYQKRADKVGDGLTHSGFITKVYPDGSYDIDHNVHRRIDDNKYKGRAITTHVSKDNILDRYGYEVQKITRPNYNKLLPKNKSFNETIVLKERKNSTPEEKVAVDFINKNKQEIAKTFNLDESETMSLSKAALGIIEQESKFGETFKKFGLDLREEYESTAQLVKTFMAINNLTSNAEASQSIARIKQHTNFTDQELHRLKTIFSLDEELDETNAAVTLTMALLTKNYNKHLAISGDKEDALYRAIIEHNNPTIANNYNEESYASNRDSDYANKVLKNTLEFEVTNESESLKTFLDNLIDSRVKENTLKIPSIVRNVDLNKV